MKRLIIIMIVIAAMAGCTSKPPAVMYASTASLGTNQVEIPNRGATIVTLEVNGAALTKVIAWKQIDNYIIMEVTPKKGDIIRIGYKK